MKLTGQIYKFGHNYENYDFKNRVYTDENSLEPNLNTFWSSGGYLDKDYDSHEGEWKIDVSKLPEHLKKYSIEIDFVFNSNVQYGCCGGCA